MEIINGTYEKIEDVKVREEITKTTVNTVEYSEADCLNTINSLVARKTQIVAEIDAEIAVNQARIDELKKLDRASKVEAVTK